MGHLAAQFAFSQSATEEAVWPLAREYGDRFGLDPALIMAVTWQESRFSPIATHTDRDGLQSYGLMQLRWATAQRVAGGLGLSLTAPTELFDPALNVQLGAKYLSDQLARYGQNLEAAVAAYNAGTARATPSGRYLNQGYVDAVLGKLPTYQRQEAVPIDYPSSAPEPPPSSWGPDFTTYTPGASMTTAEQASLGRRVLLLAALILGGLWILSRW